MLHTWPRGSKMQKKKALMFFLFLVSSVQGLEIVEVGDTPPAVVVSKGAIINNIPDVNVYNQMEHIFFLIPDVPEPPSLTDVSCADGVDKRFCDMFIESKTALRDIQKGMRITNRVLTTMGLKEDASYQATNINVKWFDTIQAVDVHSDSPNKDLKDAVGDDYISDVEMKLALRKILAVEPSSVSKREKRWLLKVIRPALKIAAKIVDPSELGKLFHGLFTGDSGILKTLAAYRAASPEDRKAFTELSEKVSEFETETRKLFVDVLQRTDDVEKTITKLQSDHYEFTNNLIGFEGMVLMQQSLISDMQRLMYVANVYDMHFEAFTQCMSNKITPIFLPISLLTDKLRELELRMPADMELVYGSNDASRYYRLTTSECIYDSRGGLIKIGIPLKKKKAAYQLFEYRPVQFAHHEYTCSLDTPATIVIKDLNTNEVYSVTELEMETCQLNTGLCLLPLSTDMDTSSVCIEILLKGSPAEIIRQNCKLECTKRAQPELSKVSEDTFVGIHLPTKAISIRCPDETITLGVPISVGSTKISLTCTQCKIYWNNRLVGLSSGIPCRNQRKPKIETLLPLQFSVLKDLMPFGDNGQDLTVFASAEEIINQHYDPAIGSTAPEPDIASIILDVLSILWDLIQSFAICFILYRNHYFHAAIAAQANQMMQMVEATEDKYTCRVPTDVYIMLWLILFCSVVALIPAIILKIYKFAKLQWNETINIAAASRRIDTIQLA